MTDSQRVSSDDGRTYPAHNLVAEFAIVRAGRGETWIGYRDVVEVNGRPVVERRHRLLALLSASSADADQLTQIANESARYNIGPISRNFNVPTTALFFFHPTSVARFSFERKGTKDIDGVATWALAFTEARRPTLVMTRAGRDVPCEGMVWVEPNSGTIVRTRLLLRNFADATGMQTVMALQSLRALRGSMFSRESGGAIRRTRRFAPTNPPWDYLFFLSVFSVVKNSARTAVNHSTGPLPAQG